MYEKYKENFLKSGLVTEAKTYENIWNKLYDIKKPIQHWNDEDLDDFMMKMGSLSCNTINKYLQFTRTFHEWVCKEEGVIPVQLKLTKDLKRYIDFDKFFKHYISRKEYERIVSLLEIYSNQRDKCIFMLAWEGLTNEDVKRIREDDICFISEEKAKIFIKNRSKRVVIQNKELVETLKNTIAEREYCKKDNMIEYKITPMLIKAAMTKVSESEMVANPSQILKGALKKIVEELKNLKEVEEHNEFDMGELSIEDIRRSRIVDFFKEGFSIQIVKTIFGKKTESDLGWLQEVANLIKREEKKMEMEMLK